MDVPFFPPFFVNWDSVTKCHALTIDVPDEVLKSVPDEFGVAHIFQKDRLARTIRVIDGEPERGAHALLAVLRVGEHPDNWKELKLFLQDEEVDAARRYGDMFGMAFHLDCPQVLQAVRSELVELGPDAVRRAIEVRRGLLLCSMSR